MKLYDRLFSFPVFRVREVDSLVPEWSSKVTRQRLKDLVRKGRVGRIGLGVYFVVPPMKTVDTTLVDPYLVGSRLTDDSILAYHTALELWGTAHSASNVVYYLSRIYRKHLIWRETEFRQVAPPKALVRTNGERVAVAEQERSGLTITYTSRERTLVDCLDRLDLAGGLEELLRSIEAWPRVKPEAVFTYLEFLNKRTLYPKVGYVLDLFASRWGLTDADLIPLSRKVPKAPVYLASREKPGRYVKRWNLLIPESSDLEEFRYHHAVTEAD